MKNWPGPAHLAAVVSQHQQRVRADRLDARHGQPPRRISQRHATLATGSACRSCSATGGDPLAWAIACTAAEAPASVVMQGIWWRIAASRIS